MKKNTISLLLILVLLASMLTGCGSSSVSYDSALKYENSVESPMEAPVYGVANDSISSGAVADQKLIKRVNINAETEDLEALLPLLNAKISELGGYTERQELYNGNMHASYRSRSMNMTIRIPADRLGEFVTQVEGVTNMVNYSESTDDVTLQYVDTESRVKALEVEQERLLELLANAETMSDLLEIESRLTDVRYELESYMSQLRSLENRVSYATIDLYISQVKVYTEPEPESVWARIGSGFKRNLKNLGENLTDFFVWIVTYSPQLIFWAAVLIVAVKLLRRKAANRKVKKNMATKQPDENP